MDRAVQHFIDIKEVSLRVCLGKTTLLLWESEGKFPRAVRLSPNKRVWLDSDITKWMLNKHSGTQDLGGAQ